MKIRPAVDKPASVARVVSLYIDQVTDSMQALPMDKIIEVAEAIKTARLTGRRIFIFGNGGSASTATHMACDLSKGGIVPDQPRIKAVSLCDNVALFSAWANDTAYEHVFTEQLYNLIEEDDVAIAISGSGNSLNVLNAVNLARAHGALTIGFCGFDGGKLAELVDIPLVVRNNTMEQIEDVHLMLAHLITSYLRAVPEPIINKDNA
jgi:D-sedoheptulose 7-phosphate isomerase